MTGRPFQDGADFGCAAGFVIAKAWAMMIVVG
jgi:hypothetical protein